MNAAQPDREPANRAAARGDCEVEVFHLDAVQRVRETAPDAEVAYRVSTMFQILADPIRVRIIHALAHEELCVCDVAAVVGLSISATSHQLKRLRDQGVVRFRKEGRMAFYHLSDDHMRRLVEDAVREVQTPATRVSGNLSNKEARDE
jgi:ArsR family transcriptional regulator, lead/cadmium/zinc/bismuth-responsive transcriptional repressor